MTLFRRLTFAALVLCFIVVVVGAFVRLSDAGLGCPDWPGCYGHLMVPGSAHDIPKAWKEMFHRYIASTLGLLVAGLAVLSVVKRREGVPRALPWVLLALVNFQGMLGMWTVTLKLVPWVVLAHLLGGMSTLALLLWMWLATEGGRRQPAGDKKIRSYAAFALGLLALQIFLGGWTSSNYAALACPDLPKCQGAWLPQTHWREAFLHRHQPGVNYEKGVLDNRARVTIHFAHRAGALAVTVVLLGLIWALWRKGAKIAAALVLTALAVQVGLGVSIVLLQRPLLPAAAHNAGAALLLLTLVAVNHRLWKSQKSS